MQEAFLLEKMGQFQFVVQLEIGVPKAFPSRGSPGRCKRQYDKP